MRTLPAAGCLLLLGACVELGPPPSPAAALRQAAVTVLASEDFSSADAGWSSAYTNGADALWATSAAGQSGNALAATRSAQGSSVLAKRYAIPSARNLKLSAYLRCPSQTVDYWMELGYRLGSQTASDFDQNVSAWTLVKKFERTASNGNGNTWTSYDSPIFYSGTSTQVTVGYKYGSSTTAAAEVAWDTFRLVEPDISRVEVAPQSLTLGVGQAYTFNASAFDSSNAPLSGLTYAWSALPQAGTLSGSRLTASCTPGTVASGVSASANGVTGSAAVTLTSPGPTSVVQLSPATATVVAGGTATFAATTRDACNNATTDAQVWTATGGSVTAGAYTAPCAPGTYQVRVTAGSITQSAAVTVTAGPPTQLQVTPPSPLVPAGEQQQFYAVGRDVCGNATSPTVTWTVQAGGGTINTSGLFTAGNGLGTFVNTIMATTGALSATTGVVVTAGPVQTFSITPATATLRVQAQQAFSVVAKDRFGNDVLVTPTWSVTQGGGAITAQGLFTAGTTAGSFAQTVRAETGTQVASATITVTPGPAAVLAVSPTRALVRPGEAWQFAAQATDGFGNPFTPASISWACAPLAGTITPGGLFQASSQGGEYDAGVTASAEGLSASAAVVVLADGAPTDAGGDPDGGSGTRLTARNGCGCTSATGPLVALALAGAWARRRQRPGRRGPNQV